MKELLQYLADHPDTQFGIRGEEDYGIIRLGLRAKRNDKLYIDTAKYSVIACKDHFDAIVSQMLWRFKGTILGKIEK